MSLQSEMNLESEYMMNVFARKPVEFVAGNGMELVDSEKNVYLDFLSGIGVDVLGHCPHGVVDALKEQAEKLIHVGNYFYIEKRGEVAKILCELLNYNLPEVDQGAWKTFFSNSGAESNEAAIKIARLYANRNALIEHRPI
ncbi:MAG: aminotransferase class III-fold pyridoxal phosphate-dependent enzyme, partial [Eggerthellaceae bacterium]|nr:aminotransferase class III-fold pyridoxal phosphate-dependent enzyme [Eggerthellaceae bacterium]